ncbi:pre-tRNA nuclear export protein [Tulasnella sp. 418]|nr:pre-tRNA nuclear export protein [Tulasnella sp. 418]
MDDDDRLAFDTMRKDLRTILDSILVIDEQLVTGAVRTIALTTLAEYQKKSSESGGKDVAIPWQDAELAVYLVFLYGEIHKPKDKGKTMYVQLPPELAADKEKRKKADFSNLPLTPYGELMYALTTSGVSNYPHVAVRGMFFECIGRYAEFFNARKDCLVSVLEALVDVRGMHHPKTNRRGRIFYIFNRFIKEVRYDLPTNLIPSLLESIQDLLELHVELPAPNSDEGGGSGGSSPTQSQHDLLDEAVKTPGPFDNQLYLFETIGMLVALVPEEQQVGLLQAVTNPLLVDLSQTIQTPIHSPKEVLPVLRAHHLIEALASVVKGFPDAPQPPLPADYRPPGRTEVFKGIAEAVLVSLEVMSGFRIVREAVSWGESLSISSTYRFVQSRFAFTRIVATSGSFVAQYIPTLILRLLSSPFEPSELVDFLMFLGLVLHRLEVGVAFWS